MSQNRLVMVGGQQPSLMLMSRKKGENGMGRMILRANALIGNWDREDGNGREIKAKMDEQRSNVFKQIK